MEKLRLFHDDPEFVKGYVNATCLFVINEAGADRATFVHVLIQMMRRDAADSEAIILAGEKKWFRTSNSC